MKVTLILVATLAAALAVGAAEPGVLEYSFWSSGCFSTSPGPEETELPQCPLPQVLRWAFEDGVLRAEFSLRANCCPQEDRFQVESWSFGDTLVIAVADTAPGDCRCSCPYLITVEYPSLSGELYTIRAVPWGDYELFTPTVVPRGSRGESEPIDSIYKRYRARGGGAKRPN